MITDLAPLIAKAQTGDKEAMEQLVLDNNGLIWAMARRFFGRGVDPDDLYQLGCVGFLKAVSGFDLEYGTQFSTYAVPKIVGEIRRFLRDDGSVKVSRSLKERATSIKITRERLMGQLGCEPTLSQLADAMGLTVEEIAIAENATTATQSIHQEAGEEGFTLEAVLSKGNPEEEMIEHIALKEAISKLPERERAVIQLRYYRGLTQAKTASILDVSQVQVSRIEKKAIEQLRLAL